MAISISDTYAREEKAPIITEEQENKFNNYVFNAVYAIINSSSFRPMVKKLKSNKEKEDAHKTLAELNQVDKVTQLTCLHILSERMLQSSRNVKEEHIIAFKVLLLPQLVEHIEKINEISVLFLQQRKTRECVKLQLKQLEICTEQDLRTLYTWFYTDFKEAPVFSEEAMPIVTYIRRANKDVLFIIKEEFLKFCKKQSLIFDEEYVIVT